MDRAVRNARILAIVVLILFVGAAMFSLVFR